jgi:hypothetical protein
MTTNLYGSRVIVKTEAGAYISGILWASSPGGSLFVKKEEVCLDVDFASQVGSWEILAKPEHWRGKGEVVEDPRTSETAL